MINPVFIDQTKISLDSPPYIIAEIGNNHNGNLDLALKLIDEAQRCGANAVKLQTKNIEKAFSKELLNKPYNGENSFGKTYREHKEALELSSQETKSLFDIALTNIINEGWKSLMPNQTLSLGLMTGITGIGYSLLRLFNSDLVPSILNLEPPKINYQFDKPSIIHFFKRINK